MQHPANIYLTISHAPIEVEPMTQRLQFYGHHQEVAVETVCNFNNAGVSHMEAGRYEEAVEFFDTALRRLEQCETCMQYAYGSSSCSEPQSLNSSQHSTASTSSAHSTGSNIDARVSRDSYIYQRREYDEGMHVFSSPIRMEGPIMDVIDSQSAAAVVVFFNLGQLGLLRHKDEEANASFLRALFLARSAMKVSPVSVVAILHNIGYIQYRNSELEKSLRTFNEAVHEFRHYSNKLELAATLNCLGVLHFHLPKSDTSRAMDYYLKALEMRKELHGSHNRDVATLLNNIGRVYYIKGAYDKALEKYLDALDIRRSLLGRDHLDVAATVYNAGQTYHQQGDLEKALKFYQEFMSITVPKLGQTHRDVAIMLKCMAQIYHERREYERALALYEEALSVGRAALGMHAEVASILNKMGNLYYERGDFDAATERYKEGLAVERAVLHSLHPNIVVTLVSGWDYLELQDYLLDKQSILTDEFFNLQTNLAQIAKQKGEYHEGLKLYKEALDIQVKSLGQSHPSIAVTLSNMGLIHYQNKSYSKSLDIYQEALRIRRDAYGENHLDVASSLNSIGLVLFKLGLHEMAMQSFVESLKIRRALLGDAHRDVAIILYNIATIHLERGDEEEAMKCYKETLKVERAALGPDHSDVILTLQYTAQVHQQRGELVDALNCLSEVLRIQRRNLNENDPSVARTLNSIANVHLQGGNAAGVVDSMAEAARIMSRAGRSDEELRLSGFHLYGFAILHPECAPCA